MTQGEQLDHTPLNKGRYQDLTASQVAEKDPAYLVWAYESWTPKPCSDLLYRDCKADVSRDLQHHRVARDQDL